MRLPVASVPSQQPDPNPPEKCTNAPTNPSLHPQVSPEYLSQPGLNTPQCNGTDLSTPRVAGPQPPLAPPFNTVWKPFCEITNPSMISQHLQGRIAELEGMLLLQKSRLEGLEKMVIEERTSRLALERKFYDFMSSSQRIVTPFIQQIPTVLPSSSLPSSGGDAQLPFPRRADMLERKTNANHFSHLKSIFATVLSTNNADGTYTIRPHILSSLLLSGGNEPTVLARSLMRRVFTPYELSTSNVRGFRKEGLDPKRVMAIKKCVLQSCQIPLSLQDSTWNMCVKAMDAANRNARRYAKKLSEHEVRQ